MSYLKRHYIVLKTIMANTMDKCVLKYDHFENIHRLPSTVLTIDGAPNYRKVPGFMVFGMSGPPRDTVYFISSSAESRMGLL